MYEIQTRHPEGRYATHQFLEQMIQPDSETNVKFIWGFDFAGKAVVRRIVPDGPYAKSWEKIHELVQDREYSFMIDIVACKRLASRVARHSGHVRRQSRYFLTDHNEILEWLASRMPGFEIDFSTCTVEERQIERDAAHFASRYHRVIGTLRVTSSEHANEKYINGVGGHKFLGFGFINLI